MAGDAPAIGGFLVGRRTQLIVTEHGRGERVRQQTNVGQAPGYSAACFQSWRCVFGLVLRRSSVSSSRSRRLLRKICSLPARYCGGQWTDEASYQAAARMVKAGSTRCGRASATRSARPAATTVFTWSAVVILPTHIVASPPSLRI